MASQILVPQPFMAPKMEINKKSKQEGFDMRLFLRHYSITMLVATFT